jgi:hypothetical protein
LVFVPSTPSSARPEGPIAHRESAFLARHLNGCRRNGALVR